MIISIVLLFINDVGFYIHDLMQCCDDVSKFFFKDYFPFLCVFGFGTVVGIFMYLADYYS